MTRPATTKPRVTSQNQKIPLWALTVLPINTSALRRIDISYRELSGHKFAFWHRAERSLILFRPAAVMSRCRTEDLTGTGFAATPNRARVFLIEIVVASREIAHL